MTRLGLIQVFIAMLICGCSIDRKPSGILTREQYAALLIEVYLAEAKLSALPITSDSTMLLYLAHEPELLKKFGLTDSSLMRTYEYYVNHPTEMEQVYTAVIDTLSLRDQRANSSSP